MTRPTLVNGRRRPRRIAARTAIALALLGLSALALSAAAAPATTSTPANTAPPSITGVAQEGHTLTAQSGSWSGTNPIGFSYQWRRCDTDGANCNDISDATSQTRVATANDVHMTLRVAVTATNSSGTGKALSDATQIVSAKNAPFNTGQPSISGTAQEGETLTTTHGTWSGSSPISYLTTWQRCDHDGGSCNPTGATGTTYKLTSADVTNTLRAKVTATNSSGSSSSTSGASAVVAAQGDAPASTSPPVVTGTLLAGSKVTLSNGSWSGSTPVSYAYRWQRCNASSTNCGSISGATTHTYTLTHTDIGNTLRGVVTASNNAGTTTAYSTLTATIGSVEPVNTSLPKITGTLTLGHTLTATNGSWSGSTPIQYFFQWQRSTNIKGQYTLIGGATKSTYTLASADVGHTLVVQVKAQNSHGPAWANSNPTGTIGGTATGAIPVSSVSLPDRLVISRVAFSPARLTSRDPFQFRARITNLQGRPVQGALVYPLPIPYKWVRTPTPEQPTGSDGWATITITPTALLPLGQNTPLVVFVRARKSTDPLLAGVSTRRLVQVKVS